MIKVPRDKKACTWHYKTRVLQKQGREGLGGFNQVYLLNHILQLEQPLF
ncbi:hypothetical protein SeI_A3975 [Salmonella enterica subsp. enterica serovar 4 [Salmonella enterica subsp. enterica serovar 4 [Salmonella enterica subsp. enterica serovar 4,[5],12:i:- str. CVM23701]|nr:hypothetical protein DC51_4434 [Salmonella enterica subsp. enterica serovar Typhimurium]AKD06375.1 hypothetical protein AX05_4420 [Salmonella enterica subsp. enterica serovar Typhimurium str. CDC 2011K-0870]AQU55045.1 hypothetical protein SEETMRM10607_23085 [Salmonella enterica subsp. enterica serovar Typhimurium]EDZ16979.1 hypothetical protein SeI_A3975 [Salmonella enterica subsp. enterica serovar 4 [Salmonella enterica subsp. enterica serovar 4 [Salmonella enterica subsp. enterica serovar 4